MNPWQDKTYADMLAASAAQWPDRSAIVDGATTITYRELFKRVQSLAGNFAELGIGEDSHVATFLGESWEHIVAHYAAIYCGATLVPMNLAWEAREIAFVLRQAEVSHILAGETYRGNSLLDKLRDAGVPLDGNLAGAGFPALKRIYQLGAGERIDRTVPTLRELLDRAATPPPPSGKLMAYIMFTSGSTAFPKGAMIRQDAALGTSYYMGERLNYNHEDRFLNILPLYHCGGLILSLVATQQRGAAFYIFEGYQEQAMLEAMRVHRCNSTGGFDIVTMRLIHGYLAERDDLPIDKMYIAPGMNVYDYLTGLDIKVITVYSLTEASNTVALGFTDSDRQHGKYANGRPLPGVEIKIADYETSQAVPANTPGEICFRGWNTMLGYYKMEPERPVFDAEGFLHTGDYGWLDEDGWLYFRGRYAMMIKTGGENVSEVEVENFLMSDCDDVRQAAVVGAPDPRWDEIVVAFVEFKDPADADPDALREACRGRLARFKVPKVIFPVRPGEWPVTPTGKIKKADLRTLAAARLREQ